MTDPKHDGSPAPGTERQPGTGSDSEPAEITRIKSELETIAASSEQNGSWLASAMETSWAMAEALLSYPGLGWTGTSSQSWLRGDGGMLHSAHGS
jgi:hypothetical protein